jgi:hypothetical protein
MSTDIYFAYGSNLLFARLHERTPSIRNLGVAVLENHRIHFDKPSPDGSGKCGIDAVETGETVIGVLYEMAKAEKPVLDEIEGVGHGYLDETVTVMTVEGPVDAFTYYPTLIDRARKPYDWYHALVLAGARENGLPDDYVALIESVEVQVDGHARRRAENLAILERMTVPGCD